MGIHFDQRSTLINNQQSGRQSVRNENGKPIKLASNIERPIGTSAATFFSVFNEYFAMSPAMKLSACVFLSLFFATKAFQHQRSHQLQKLACSRNRSSPTHLGAYVDINENCPRDIVSMDEWASACGVQRCDGFQLTSTDESGLDVGVLTSVDLAAESPVLFIPNEMILSARQAVQEIGRVEASEKRLVSAKAAEHVPKFYLFLKILQEYEKGDQSSWYPWLNSLPRYYSNGASMTPFCFDCLPPLAGNLAMGERIKFIQFYQALRFVDFLSDEVKGSKELAKWAFAVLYTRGFPTPDGDFRIVPMADMFNHGTQTEAQLYYDEEGNCSVYTTTDVPAGSSLRVSYGDPTNPSFLFARYGFLDESSPATFCKIMVPRPSARLKDIGYDHSRMLFFKDTGDVSEEVWDVLLYQLLESEPNVQEQFYNAHMNGDYQTKAGIHEHYFHSTSVALQNHVNTFLRDLEILQAKGNGLDISEHPRFPIIMKHNAYVKETFLKVQEQLAQYA
jgi:hypothetical protein